MTNTSSTKKGILLLLISALLYSIMPILIRILGNNGIPPISQVGFRYIVAFIAALVYYKLTTRTKFFLPKKNLVLMLFATIFGYGLTNLFFTIAILNTQVSNALFLFYTYAIIAPIFGFIILKDKVNKFNVFSLMLSSLALILLFQPTSFITWKIGGIFAILCSLGQATYLLARKKLHIYPANYMMLANTLLGTLCVCALAFIFETNFYTSGAIQYVSANTWLVTLLFGLDNFFAWLAMTKGFEYFKATASSVILLSELVFGIFFAFLFFQEIPTIMTFLGGLLIIISSVLVIYKGEN